MSRGVSLGLTGKDVAAQRHAFIVAHNAGVRPNAFGTYMPPRDMPAAERPRLFQTYRGHLSQALARQCDIPLIAIFVREAKAADDMAAGEHLHFPIWLPGEKAMAIAGEVHGDRVRLEWNDGTYAGDLARLRYCQKQRTGQFDGWLKSQHDEKPRHEWEQPAPIIGLRWSLSSPLLEIVQADRPSFAVPRNKPLAKERRRKIYAGYTRPKREAPAKPQFTIIEGGQIELFDAKPVCRLHDYGGGLMPQAVAVEIRFHLKRLGMTQDDLARAALLGRPTITNALEGRFPLSEWAARRIRETLLLPVSLAA